MPESRWTTRALRKYNRAAALSRLYEQGSASRQELAELTGLSSATVTNVITELLADGLVVEAGSVSSAGGRPRGILRVATEDLRFAGVDVGETEIRVGLFDGALNPLEMASRSPGADLAPGHIVALVTDAIAEVTAKGDGVPLLGVGVGVPGAVDERPGTETDDGLVYAPTLGWDAVPFGSMVAAGAGAPVHLENCATALGQAEMWFGAGRGAQRAVVTLLGIGVGAALMTSDSSPRGGSGLTSEWGHTVVQLDGRLCRCGSQGCLEAYVGADAVLARYREAGGDPVLAARGTQEALRALIARADTDDIARTVLDDTAKVLGVGVGNLINLLAPDRVVIAGWAGLVLGPTILPAVREVARKHALPHAYAAVTIGLGESGQDAVARGAASLPVLALLRSGSLPADATVEAG
ncbi:MAG TPA: ROK family transcriptional regulator [Pseudonocardiaceae bacterium]|nr:ROK family transcriptional regulator [Pseudonocardiaceae bacterium]